MEADNFNDVSFNDFIDEQLEFYNKIKNQNKDTGVRITDNNNTYKYDPFDGYSPFNSKKSNIINSNTFTEIDYKQLNLNIDNYNTQDLFKLFNINSNMLDDNDMKNSKKIVLKTHPDKSRLEPKYFIFYSKAYKRLQNIYEFQNKTINKKQDRNEYFDDNNITILDNYLTNNIELNNVSNFNEWFNTQFEKYNINNYHGYDNWLKSDEGILNVSQENIFTETFNAQFEKYKKQVQDVVNYKGIENNYINSNIATSDLIENNNNYSSNSILTNTFSYTDIKQAYTETIIPITNDDYINMKKYNNIEEYKTVRQNQELTPLNKDDSINILLDINKQNEEEAVALAYYYAKELEENNKKQQDFWCNLRQITNK
jgi:hypothetical protein